MNEKIDLVRESGVWATLGYTREIQKLVDLVAEKEREKFFAALRTEYETWNGTYKPLIKVALEHCIQRIDPDATL